MKTDNNRTRINNYKEQKDAELTKAVFSNKEVLAVVLKDTVPELKEFDRKEIVAAIEKGLRDYPDVSNEGMEHIGYVIRVPIPGSDRTVKVNLNIVTPDPNRYVSAKTEHRTGQTP